MWIDYDIEFSQVLKMKPNKKSNLVLGVHLRMDIAQNFFPTQYPQEDILSELDIHHYIMQILLHKLEDKLQLQGDICRIDWYAYTNDYKLCTNN